MFHLSPILSNSWCAQAHRPLLPSLVRLLGSLRPSISSSSHSVDQDCHDFLPWLEQKAGTEISSALFIGKSSYGRALYAAKDIFAGDCLLKVPCNVQLAPDNLPPDVRSLLGDQVSHFGKVALLILQEQKLGESSQWAPYISRLPGLEDMHSTIFWSCDELKMIHPSSLHKETLSTKTQIEKDFHAVKLAFDQFPCCFQDIKLQEFKYAYGLVTSRAWECPRGVSLIPFADFLNHDCKSESYVLSDEANQHSEVIADRDYASGDQVMICYGRYSNAALLLGFGFTLSHNIHDQVEVELNIPQDDRLFTQKMELLNRYQTPSLKDINKFTSCGTSFTIKEVRASSRKGKGIPQSLRAFCRILSSNSQKELNKFVTEASMGDGRLARYPLKDKNREIEAHHILLSEISRLIEEHNAHIKLLGSRPSHLCENNSSMRRRLAQDLLGGELRVLNSAALWLKNYCSTLLRN